jgi:hypothetical protein
MFGVILTPHYTAYAMRLFELGIREFFFMDSIWVILLSVSTVGYGDIFPETDYGRFVLVLHQVAGVVVLSTLVAVLQSKLSLSNRCVEQMSLSTNRVLTRLK